MFLFDDIDVLRNDVALPVSLREVIEHRKRLFGCRREAAASRADAPSDQIQPTRCGFRACCRQRGTINDHPASISARFLVVDGGFAVMLGDRWTGLGVVKSGSGRSPAMLGHDFSAAGHFAVMPGKV